MRGQVNDSSGARQNGASGRIARVIRSRAAGLWTSAEAASAFRVGVSSIKRWTDDGELEAVKTPGRHRRYTLLALHRFASIRKIPVDLLPPLTGEMATKEVPLPADLTLFEALRSGDQTAVRQLIDPRAGSVAQRAAFFDRVVGDALREIGDRWQEGALSIDQEHRASYMIAEEIDRLRPVRRAEGPLAVLACPPGELHELPLRLVRLILEWSGWRTDFAGASLPWKDACPASHRDRADLLALSARSSDPFGVAEFDELVLKCREAGTRVVIGGGWARGGAGVLDDCVRFRTLRGFERWLRSEGKVESEG
jgi:excisionase family DNA binding protein